MNESRPNQKSPFRPMITVLGLIVVIPLLLCGGLVTWFFGRHSVAAKELDQRVEALRSDDVAVDWKSLETLHHSLTSDEHTGAWSDVIAQIKSQEFVDESALVPWLGDVAPAPPPGTDWPAEDDVTAFLERWKPLRTSIHELVGDQSGPDELPVRRQIEFEGIGTLMPETQEIRSVARLLALEHDVALRQNDGEQALACILGQRRLKHSLDGEPMLISQLIGLAIGQMANSMLRQSLENDLLDESQLREADAAIPSFQQSYDSFQLTLQGERACVLPAFTDPDVAQQFLEWEGASQTAKILTKLRARDGLYLLDEVAKLESLPSDDLRSFYQAGRDWNLDLQSATDNASTADKADHVLSYMLLPSFGAVTIGYARCVENDRLARLAIAVRLYHHQFGHWPEDLSKLDQVNLDPASVETAGSQPFGYEIEDEGVVLWGVDRSQSDEIPTEPPEVVDADDINANWVWRLRP